MTGYISVDLLIYCLTLSSKNHKEIVKKRVSYNISLNEVGLSTNQLKNLNLTFKWDCLGHKLLFCFLKNPCILDLDFKDFSISLYRDRLERVNIALKWARPSIPLNLRIQFKCMVLKNINSDRGQRCSKNKH